MSRNVNYDCTLEYGSTTIPLMLITEPTTKLKKFLSYFASPLGQSIQTGESSSANFPPEQELTIEQKEFHGGMGWTNAYKMIGNKVYAYSNGVDARVRGKLKLAPKENTAAITLKDALTTASYANMDFETWSDATTLGTWTKSGTAPVVTNRSTDKSAGTYACNLEQHFADDFTSDGWTDTGTKIVVTGGVLAFEAEHSATDTRCTKDMTVISDTVWNMNFDLNVTDKGTGGFGTVYIGAFSLSENPNGGTGDSIYIKLALSSSPPLKYSATIESRNGGAVDATGAGITNLAAATTYYCTLLRSSATAATVRVYSDAARTTLVDSVSITVNSGVTSLRYLQVTNYNDNAGATIETIGTVDNVEFRGAQVTGDLTIYQDLSTWADYYKNKSATFTCRAKTVLANNLRIGIYDGTTTSYSDYHTGGGTYETLSVVYAPAAAASALRIVVERKSTTYASGDVIDTATFEQAAASRGNPLAPQSFIHFLTDYYYLENKTIYKLSGTTFTEVYTFEDVITGVEVYGANLIVSVGVDDYYYYTANGTAWTRTATASYKMIQLRTIGSTLYGGDTTYSVKTATDPIGGTWSSNTTIGNTGTDITDIVEYFNTAFIGKEDGLYYIDNTGDVISVAPDFKTVSSAYNCLGMKTWQGVILIPLNVGMYIYYYSGGNYLLNVSPARYMSAFSDFHGRVHAVSTDADWVYLAASSSTATSSKTPILAMRYEAVGETEVETDYRYHSLVNVDLDDVIAMDVYSSKLWIAGKKSTTAYIRYLSLANDDYPTSGTFTFYTSYYDSNFPSFHKSYHSFELQSENLTASVTVKVEFQIDGGTWTELSGTGTGTFTSSTAPQVKYFQTSTYGRKIRFRFTMATNSGTTTPVITGFIVRGALRPDTLRVQEWWIDCSDNLTVNNGLTTRNTASKIKSDLETAKAQTWALTVYDPYGTTWYGFIKSPTPEIQGYEFSLGTGKDKRIKSVVHIILQEARLSA